MICVSVMLAIFLGWPLAFGSHDGSIESSRVEAKSVAAASKPSQHPMLEAAVQAAQAAVPAGTVQVESCYKRYQREVKQCTGSSSAACRLKSADNWDLCEARGFWPN